MSFRYIHIAALAAGLLSAAGLGAYAQPRRVKRSPPSLPSLFRSSATLFNGAGLPAAPFPTDTWPGETKGHRPH